LLHSLAPSLRAAGAAAARMRFCFIVIDIDIDAAAPGRSAHHPGITPGRVICGDGDTSPVGRGVRVTGPREAWVTCWWRAVWARVSVGACRSAR
jgi:hypothetical protein